MERKVVYRYSLAFKKKVVSEIEEGKISITQAQRFYDIGGKTTIQKWIWKLGKNHLLCKVVRIELKDEKDIIKELKKEKQKLESALAQSHLKIMALESLVEIAKEKYDIDLKKKSGMKVSKKQKKK